jgi:hypothetical protein
MQRSKQPPPKVRAEFKSVAEMTDHEIERIIEFGRREAELIDRLEIATRAGDRELAWELSKELLRK